MSPSILYLAHAMPDPPVSGDRVRNFHLIRELSSHGWDVHLVALAAARTRSSFAESKRNAGAGFGAASVLELAVVPSRAVRMVRLGMDTVARRSYETRWFWARQAAVEISRAYHQMRPDVVLFSQLFMAAYVDGDWRVPIVFDTQNVEADRVRSVSNSDGSRLRRWIHGLQIGPTEAYERQVVTASDLVLAVSQIEAAAFRAIAPRRVVVIPNGVDVESPEAIATREGMLFVGSFGYGANRDAFVHLRNDILPHIRTDAVLVTVGSGKPPTQRRGYVDDRIRFVGAVDEIAPYYRRARVLVAPLRHGGGTKLKILEAMANGTPVVTTSIGAAGLEVETGRHLLVADDPREFARLVDRVLCDSDLSDRLSVASRNLVAAQYSWQSVGELLDRALRSAARTGRRVTIDPRSPCRG